MPTSLYFRYTEIIISFKAQGLAKFKNGYQRFLIIN